MGTSRARCPDLWLARDGGFDLAGDAGECVGDDTEVIKPPLVLQAEADAARAGLTFDWGDQDWPMMRKRIVSLEIQRDGKRVAGTSHTYSDEEGRVRAMEFCAALVYFRPSAAD